MSEVRNRKILSDITDSYTRKAKFSTQKNMSIGLITHYYAAFSEKAAILDLYKL